MVISNKEEQTYVFTKKIEFTMGTDEVEFVTLREFNMQEAKQFQQANKVDSDGKVNDLIAGITKAEEFFPGCVVDSSFQNENGEKATGKQVYDFLKKSSSLFQLILTKWLQEDDSPFQLLNSKK